MIILRIGLGARRLLWLVLSLVLFHQLAFAQPGYGLTEQQAQTLDRILTGSLAGSDLDNTVNLYIQPLNPEQRDYVNLQVGMVLVQRFQYASSVPYLEKAAKSELALLSAEANFYLGEGYLYRYVHSTSIKHYQIALDQYTSIPDSMGMGRCLDRIADNHNYLGDHALARTIYDQAIPIFQALDNKIRLSNVLGNIGGMELDDGNYDSARYFYEKAIGLDKAAKDSSNLRTHTSGLARILEYLDKDQESLKMHREAYRLAHLMKDDFEMAFANQHLGYFYSRKNQPDSTIAYMTITNAIGQKLNNAQLTINSLEALTEAYKKKGQYQLALSLHEELVLLQDSIFTLETSKEIEEIRAQYEVEKKEAENAALRSQAELQQRVIANRERLNTILLVAAGLLMLLVITLVTFLRHRRRKNRIIEKDRDTIKSQAEKLEQLAAFKARFFANISHDFKSPIHLISGYMQLIHQEKNQLTEASEEALLHMKQNLTRLNKMSEEIRDLIQLEEQKVELKYEKVAIRQVVQDEVSSFKSSAKSKGIDLSFQSGLSPEMVIHSDVNAIERIVQNLLENALKYNTTGRLIEVHLKKSGNEALLLEVTDDGPGISQDELSKVFERYYQSHTANGQGIGLSLVKLYTELLNGSAEVRSEQGVSTTFSITMPYNLDKPVKVENNTGNIVQQPVNQNIETQTEDRQMVLVVDDQPNARKYLRAVLDKHYMVLEATDGHDAWYILQSTPSIALVITDLSMPRVNGYELIERIREDKQISALPVIVIAASLAEDESYEPTDNSTIFIRKPLNEHDIRDKAARMINQSMTTH